MRHPSLLVFVSCVWLAGCNRQPEGASGPAAGETRWSAVRDALIEEYLKAHPAYAVVQGRHEYDGQLPDWSGAGIAAEIRRLHAARDRALAVADAGLNPQERSSTKRRHITAPTSPTSIFQARTRKVCLPCITSRRPTHRGAPRSSVITCRGRRTCCSRPCTKCGRATSSSSCTPTAIRRSWDGCSSDTHLPKDGRITPRK